MYQEFKPRHLHALIDAIWYSDSDVDPDTGHIVSPNLNAELVIKLYQSDIETVLSGPVTRQKQYPFVAGARYFGVRFATDVGPIFDVASLQSLKNTSVEIGAVIGMNLTTLAQRLHDLQTWSDQRALIETSLRRNFPENRRFINPNVQLAIHLAKQVHGNIPVTELATLTGVGKRHLERLFLQYTGLSPKTFCTNLRIQTVLERLHKRPLPSLAYLALDCGYADQAHLANEFKQVIGTSISTYLETCIFDIDSSEGRNL